MFPSTKKLFEEAKSYFVLSRHCVCACVCGFVFVLFFGGGA